MTFIGGAPESKRDASEPFNCSRNVDMKCLTQWNRENCVTDRHIYSCEISCCPKKKKNLKKKIVSQQLKQQDTVKKKKKKKLTFHYTQIGQYTRCMLPKQFHNVHLLNVDSVNMIFKYNIYRRYNVDLLLYTSTRTRDIYVKCFHL